MEFEDLEFDDNFSKFSWPRLIYVQIIIDYLNLKKLIHEEVFVNFEKRIFMYIDYPRAHYFPFSVVIKTFDNELIYSGLAWKYVEQEIDNKK